MADFEKMSQRSKEFKRREEAILDASLDLFLRYGEEKVTVEMIADEVGIGKGTVYKHFQTKNEIYLTLMIRYEEELAALFSSVRPEDSKVNLARNYFHFRMKDPSKYALFYRLENRCVAEGKAPHLIDKLHEIRASNMKKLKKVIQARINEGSLEDVHPYFHICAAWALVHGAVALYQSDFFHQSVENQSEFFEFLIDIGVRMGNKGQYRPQ